MNNANVFFISPVKQSGFRNATAAPAAATPVRTGGGAAGAATPVRTGGGAAGANPTGAIATAAASVINNTVDNLFQNKVYKSQAELLKAQAETEKMKAKLLLLSNEQKNVLAAQLQEMKDDNAKTQLLNDMVVAISTAQLNASQYNVNEIFIAALQNGKLNAVDPAAITASAANNQIKLALIVLVAAIVVVGAAVLIKKKQ